MKEIKLTTNLESDALQISDPWLLNVYGIDIDYHLAENNEIQGETDELFRNNGITQ